MKLISSLCERLIRAPRVCNTLLSVCEAMRAVISTACEWCMIMPCMKSISACERCGEVGLVVGGIVLLGVPGAPGWTTGAGLTGVCCACVVCAKGLQTETVTVRQNQMNCQRAGLDLDSRFVDRRPALALGCTGFGFSGCLGILNHFNVSRRWARMK